jgi:hypothetical protein
MVVSEMQYQHENYGIAVSTCAFSISPEVFFLTAKVNKKYSHRVEKL